MTLTPHTGNDYLYLDIWTEKAVNYRTDLTRGCNLEDDWRLAS